MNPVPVKHTSHDLRLSAGRRPAALDLLHLEVRDLRLMVAVAEEGSLTRAATRLNVTQPALSRHLQSLEMRVGAGLFLRTGTRMRLAPAGELLVRHAREILTQVACTESDLRALGNAPRRQLRVATECYTAYHWLPNIVSRFASRYPGVDVQIAFEAARQPLKPLLAGDIDVALVSEGVPRRGIVTTKLFTDEYVAVVAPGHALAARSFVVPPDFEGARLLLVAPPAGSTVLQRFLKPAGIRLQQVADVQLVGALAALVEAQFGIGVLPSWSVAPEIRLGRLVPLRLGKDGLKRLWLAAVAAPSAQERWVQDFVQMMAANGPVSALSPAESRRDP